VTYGITMAGIKIKKLYRRVNTLKNKKYFKYEAGYMNIQNKNGITHISAGCYEIPCSYEEAYQKAIKDKELINKIDRLRK
jgi:hypothetical protein